MSKNDPGNVTIEPAAPATASVIWLHGLGADGHDFEPVVPQLDLGESVRFVFPHAPVQPVALNGGMAMRAWFDIERLDFNGSWDATGVQKSVDRVVALVNRELQLEVARSRIVVAGFSQGGSVALEYLRQSGGGLAGVMALSTFHAAGVTGIDPAPPDAPPIFAAHGTQDPVVPFEFGERSLAAFSRAGYEVAWHQYPMQHQLCMPEIADIAAWLKTRLDPANA
jgi:phospholipase/carboxylesterase